MPSFISHYEAVTVFDDEAIYRMFRTEYFTYERLKILRRVCVGIVLIAGGLFLSLQLPAKVIMMLFGCWFVVSTDFPSKVQAETVLERRRGQISSVKYRFSESMVEIQSVGQLKYTEIERMVADNRYFYLFQNRQNAIMVLREAIRPEEPEAFAAFMEAKTGQQWQPVKGILSFNFRDLRQMIADQTSRR